MGGPVDAASRLLERARSIVEQHSPLHQGAPRVVQLTAAHQTEAVPVMAAAFGGAPGSEGDALFSWALGPKLSANHADKRRSRWFTWYMTWIFLAGAHYGLVIGARDAKSGRLTGVAVALPPGRLWAADASSWSRPHVYHLGLRMGGPPPDALTPGQYAHGTSERMKQVSSAIVHDRMRAAARTGTKASGDEAWFLYFLGVAPEARRAGCARALLCAVSDICAETNRPCLLEASSECARAACAQSGFETRLTARPRVESRLHPAGQPPPMLSYMLLPSKHGGR
mmetsp:Transcript_14831/g.39923  ORF Transcript_14831/g.39923 Transcript_14831/m.39923 type:complete len:283 (+) Transcript_14831:68-916(+)